MSRLHGRPDARKRRPELVRQLESPLEGRGVDYWPGGHCQSGGDTVADRAGTLLGAVMS